MNTELREFVKRGVADICAAHTSSPYMTSEQWETICSLIVCSMDLQRRVTRELSCGNQVWGTVGQIARLLNMTSSGARSLIERIKSFGLKLDETDPNAIPGRRMHKRYRIVDVEIGRKLLELRALLCSTFRTMNHGNEH